MRCVRSAGCTARPPPSESLPAQPRHAALHGHRSSARGGGAGRCIGLGGRGGGGGWAAHLMPAAPSRLPRGLPRSAELSCSGTDTGSATAPSVFPARASGRQTRGAHGRAGRCWCGWVWGRAGLGLAETGAWGTPAQLRAPLSSAAPARVRHERGRRQQTGSPNLWCGSSTLDRSPRGQALQRGVKPPGRHDGTCGQAAHADMRAP